MEDVLNAHRANYARVAPSRTEVMPSVRDALDAMMDDEISLAVATYSPRPLALAIMYAIGLTRCFTGVAAPTLSERPSNKAKLLQAAVRQLGVPVDNAIFVGDHEHDRDPASVLGMRFIRYPDYTWADIRGKVVARNH